MPANIVSRSTRLSSWEQRLWVKYFEMEIEVRFWNDEGPECSARARIDTIYFRGLTFDIGGGPDSFVDVSSVSALYGLDPEDIDEALVEQVLDALLARLQRGPLTLDYPGSD